MKLAIIPARGGSKRIPRKNIKKFVDHPIIGYAIIAAQCAGIFDDVIVSTDDPEIAAIAARYTIKLHWRSEVNSSDTAGTVPVLLEVLAHYPQALDICCIYPCNPFLTGKKLRSAYYGHIETNANSTFPVVRYGYPPQRALGITNGCAEMLHPENYSARSQDLEPVYHDAGQFYWLNVEALRQQEKLFMARSTPIITSELEAQDIDNIEDWTLAEVKYQLWRKNNLAS